MISAILDNPALYISSSGVSVIPSDGTENFIYGPDFNVCRCDSGGNASATGDYIGYGGSGGTGYSTLYAWNDASIATFPSMTDTGYGFYVSQYEGEHYCTV